MILQILPHKLQGFLIGYALGDALLLNFSITRQNSHLVIQEKNIPKLGFLHGYKTQQILQYLTSWDSNHCPDIDEYHMMIENTKSVLEYYGRPYNISFENSYPDLDMNVFACALRRDFFDMMDWHSIITNLYHSNCYERVGNLILGAILWGFFRGLTIAQCFEQIAIWRQTPNALFIGIDDVVWWHYEQSLLLRTQNGVQPCIDFLQITGITSHLMAHIIDLLWLIQQGPISDNIHILLGTTQIESNYFEETNKETSIHTYQSSHFFIQTPRLDCIPLILGFSAGRLGYDSIPFWMREYCLVKETIHNFFVNQNLDFDELLLFEHACVEDMIQMIIQHDIHNQYVLMESYKKWLHGHVEIPDQIITDVRKKRKKRKKTNTTSTQQLKLF